MERQGGLEGCLQWHEGSHKEEGCHGLLVSIVMCSDPFTISVISAPGFYVLCFSKALT